VTEGHQFGTQTPTQPHPLDIFGNLIKGKTRLEEEWKIVIIMAQAKIHIKDVFEQTWRSSSTLF